LSGKDQAKRGKKKQIKGQSENKTKKKSNCQRRKKRVTERPKNCNPQSPSFIKKKNAAKISHRFPQKEKKG